MTKITSSRSVRGTPKVEPKPVSSGTPRTARSSGSILGSTTWKLMLQNGTVRELRVEGGRGRISFGGGRGGEREVRVYRNESTKIYDAVISGVDWVLSDRCTFIDPQVKQTEDKPVPWKLVTAKEKDEWESLASGTPYTGAELYERALIDAQRKKRNGRSETF